MEQKKELKFYQYGEEIEKIGKLLDECVDEETGEIADEVKLIKAERLADELQKQLVVKAADVIKFYKNRELFIKAAKEEKARIAELLKSAESKQEKFDKYLLFCMKKMGVDTLETIQGTIKIKKSKRTDILDETIIPKDYIEIVQTNKISKDSIKKAIQAGKEVPGAAVNEYENINVK